MGMGCATGATVVTTAVAGCRLAKWFATKATWASSAMPPANRPSNSGKIRTVPGPCQCRSTKTRVTPGISLHQDT